jgi:hypothetical protein
MGLDGPERAMSAINPEAVPQGSRQSPLVTDWTRSYLSGVLYKIEM